jgi:hypothetical protein
MLITRTSRISGKTNTMDIDISQEQLDKYNNGCLIQDVMGNISVDEREFIITGITPEEWKELFGD